MVQPVNIPEVNSPFAPFGRGVEGPRGLLGFDFLSSLLVIRPISRSRCQTSTSYWCAFWLAASLPLVWRPGDGIVAANAGPGVGYGPSCRRQNLIFVGLSGWPANGHIGHMTKPRPAPFYCPQCRAKYEIVRMESPSVEVNQKIACISCGGPLNDREGAFILKYFLVNRPEKERASRVDVVRASR